jgi:Uma2 family endonuclease
VYALRPRFSYEEYLQLEDGGRVRHEFLDGFVWAMPRGPSDHIRVTSNVTTLLSSALIETQSVVFTADLRIRVQATGLATYPDVSVVCGKLALDPEDRKGHTATNPIVLVEVLSAGTENYDRGEKLGHYKQIATLQEVLLVAHDRREVEIVRREADGSWSRHIARAGDSVPVLSLECELSVAAIYRDPLAER